MCIIKYRYAYLYWRSLLIFPLVFQYLSLYLFHIYTYICISIHTFRCAYMCIHILLPDVTDTEKVWSYLKRAKEVCKPDCVIVHGSLCVYVPVVSGLCVCVCIFMCACVCAHVRGWYEPLTHPHTLDHTRKHTVDIDQRCTYFCHFDVVCLYANLCLGVCVSAFFPCAWLLLTMQGALKIPSLCVCNCICVW